MSKNKIPLDNPGEILLEEFLKPMNITQYELAKSIHVPQIRISEIVRGLRAITPDTALRLSQYFKTSANFWLNLQNDYDLRLAKRKLKIKNIKIYPTFFNSASINPSSSPSKTRSGLPSS
ncbi:HigA family addiction module antidote protein [Candidatus Peregrinibacteria bacterium]|nr:HigA family addiction module antidote protein [Candidatus Peregrinibacteria bacterium]